MKSDRDKRTLALLTRNAKHSEREAVASLRSAIAKLKLPVPDRAGAEHHVGEAALHLGEARGYRNAIADVAEQG